VIARQQFGFLRHGQPARDSELGAGESFSEGQVGAATAENASVNPLAPANGIGRTGGFWRKTKKKHASNEFFPPWWGRLPYAQVTSHLLGRPHRTF
jgi:hypothetical protein